MSEPEISRSADRRSLQQLPRLAENDRVVLERMLIFAPEAAMATASAILRTHQGDLHKLFFPDERRDHRPDIGNLAAALVYLGLAMSAPSQGKILPILSVEHFRQARRSAADLLSHWAEVSQMMSSEGDGGLLPDLELRRLIETFAERAAVRSGRDPRWVRAVVFGEAAAFYAVMAQVCAEQFQFSGDLASVSAQLERVARTRDLLVDVLAGDEKPRPFDPSRRETRLARLRGFGWVEFQSSNGRSLSDLAQLAAQRGLITQTVFALGDEWEAHGASRPTTGLRYFIRPSMLPDSSGLALWAQEERLQPLQKILSGDPSETGLRMGLGTVELFLEFGLEMGPIDFLLSAWTRTSNAFDGMQTRFGLTRPGEYAITLFPGARREESVGICPVIEVLPV